MDPPNFHLHASAAAAASEWDISDPKAAAIYADSERRHPWFRERGRRILDFLARDGAPPPARVLEVGCGAGPVLGVMAAAGYEVVGVEMHAPLGREAALAIPAGRVYCLDVTNPPEAFRREAPFDVVGLFDVIEHVDDPAGLLRASARRLRPGGLLVGTVPALALLWSDYDVAMGHRLRYARADLQALFDKLGLPLGRADYFFQVLVPGLLARATLVGRRGAALGVDARRRIFDRSLRPPGKVAEAAFGALFALERLWNRALPAGGVGGTSLWFSSTVEDPARL